MANKYSILRIYFESGAKVESHGFWKKMWNSSLREHLLKKAKEINIKQALCFEAKSGYLNYENIKHHVSEVSHLHHPICLEIIDMDEKIREFSELNKQHLNNVTVIILNPDLEILYLF